MTSIHDQSAASSPAPWRSLFQSDIEKTKAPYFVLSTVARDGKGAPVPRARYCVFRGFFCDQLKLHPSNEDDLKKHQIDGLNPTTFESDMLTFTTDVRMAKVDQLVQSGGVVEAVFLVNEAASQWRVKGKAFVIGGSPTEKEELDARAEIRRTLRIRQQGDVVANNKEWSWDKEVTAYFACLHPIRRGSSFLLMNLRLEKKKDNHAVILLD